MPTKKSGRELIDTGTDKHSSAGMRMGRSRKAMMLAGRSPRT